jgi:hypothetical protein
VSLLGRPDLRGRTQLVHVESSAFRSNQHVLKSQQFSLTQPKKEDSNLESPRLKNYCN